MCLPNSACPSLFLVWLCLLWRLFICALSRLAFQIVSALTGRAKAGVNYCCCTGSCMFRSMIWLCACCWLSTTPPHLDRWSVSKQAFSRHTDRHTHTYTSHTQICSHRWSAMSFSCERLDTSFTQKQQAIWHNTTFACVNLHSWSGESACIHTHT
jgi:hypothetical protein